MTDVSREFGIDAQPTDDSQQASEQINRAKYAGVVLDFDTVPNARPFIDIARASRSNGNAVLFAIATNISHMEQALQDRAHFLLHRPIGANTIRKTIRNAYDLMSGRHRRDFRCSVSLPVRLTPVVSGVSIDCATMNVSSNGMGVETSSALKIAEPMDIALVLPDGFIVRATGIVVWNDERGRSGLNFQCADPEMRCNLDLWLDSQFAAAHVQKGWRKASALSNPEFHGC
jgi:hypothetical protein